MQSPLPPEPGIQGHPLSGFCMPFGFGRSRRVGTVMGTAQGVQGQGSGMGGGSGHWLVRVRVQK